MSSEKVIPDGGWGWAVVGGAALINVVNQSLLSIFGLIFGSKLEHVAGATGVTTVMSVNCTISNFSGLLIGPLSRFFSTRQITQIGIFFVSGGLAFSAYAQTYDRIIFGYGLCTGLGFGLIASSSFLIMNSYFDRNKSQAVGLGMAGTSIGQMIMPLVVAYLVEYFGYDGTILLLCGLSLHGLVGAMFFDPVSEHMVSRDKIRSNSLLSSIKNFFCCSKSEETENSEENPISVNNNVNVEDNNYQKDKAQIPHNIKTQHVVNEVVLNEASSSNLKQSNVDLEEGQMLPKNKADLFKEEESFAEEPNNTSTYCHGCISLFGFQFLLDPIFLHIMIGLSLAYTTSIAFSTFFPLFLTEDLDLTIMDASRCMSILSFFDFLGRIVVPIITKKIKTTNRTVFLISSFFLAISRSVLVLQKNYSMLLIFSAVCGLTRAATVINQNLVIAEYSKDCVSSAVGLNMVSKGIFVLTIGRILGMYKDSAHNFAGCIHIVNIISIAVVISWSIEAAIRWIYQVKRRLSTHLVIV